MRTMRPVTRLRVVRTLSDGQKIAAGELARNARGEIFFAWSDDYLDSGLGNLSPFKFPGERGLIRGPAVPWDGLHGVFADSLPDGWGLLLQDRSLRARGIDPRTAGPLDRLAMTGSRGIGALSYEPADEEASSGDAVTLPELGLEAERELEGLTAAVLPELVRSGASGGSRPKSQVFLSPDGERLSLDPFAGSVPWLVKFTSSRTPLGHEEGICEAIWLALQKKAGIRVPEWHLFEGPRGPGRPEVSYWLGMRRFDVTESGRLHRVSAAGLLDADFRTPCLDYLELLKLVRLLAQTRSEAEEFARRAVFSWLSLNQDDHSRNFSFLQADDGAWRLSPSYDVTYSPSPCGEHATAFAGQGRTLDAEGIRRFGKAAGLAPRRMKEIAESVLGALALFPEAASELGLAEQTAAEITASLAAVRRANAPAFGIPAS